MNKIKKLVCFDFDDTICHTIKPEEGKDIWHKAKGEVWPHIGWWSKPETLDLDIFDTKINPYVHSAYLDVKSDPNNFVFLATGRVEKLREEVTAVLDNLGLEFEAIYLNTGGDTFKFKTKLFEKMIRSIKPEEFIMFDDREEHIVKFREWAKTIDCKITIIDVIHKTTEVFD